MQQTEKVNIIPAADDPSPPIVQAASNAVTPMEMLNAAVARGADIAVLEKLMDLQERWEAGRARKAFDAAIAAAKAEIPVIRKNREVDFTSSKGRTNYRHEDFGEIARTIDPILGKHGLSYRFRATSNLNEPVMVTCIVSHRDGRSEETTLTAGRDESGNKNSIQGIGSTITYLQRYTLKAALGLAASNDDDGKASSEVETITPAQADHLRDLIKTNGKSLDKFMRWARVDQIEDIAAEYYEACVNALQHQGAAR